MKGLETLTMCSRNISDFRVHSSKTWFQTTLCSFFSWNMGGLSSGFDFCFTVSSNLSRAGRHFKSFFTWSFLPSWHCPSDMKLSPVTPWEERPLLTPQAADVEPAKAAPQLTAAAIESHLGRLLPAGEGRVLIWVLGYPSQSRWDDSWK